MALKLLASLPVLAAAGHASSTVSQSEFEISQDHLFDEFTSLFGRVYESEEERIWRRAVFVKNLKAVEEMTLLDDGAVYSHLTPFADWTSEEFVARNTLNGTMFDEDASVALDDDAHATESLPSSFDWREKGAVNPIKNQEQCGSCWAFSTVANIEGVNFLKTGDLLSLSEQQLVSCSGSGNHGCFGGLQSYAFKDMLKHDYGLELERDYPYHPLKGLLWDHCKAKKSEEVVFLSGWKRISKDEDRIAAALLQHGPLAIALDASAMQSYHHGVANPGYKCAGKVDHAVNIVGFGVDRKKYWTIRNSWGSHWGEHGYYRLVRGKGACRMNTMVVTATSTHSVDSRRRHHWFSSVVV